MLNSAVVLGPLVEREVCCGYLVVLGPVGVYTIYCGPNGRVRSAVNAKVHHNSENTFLDSTIIASLIVDHSKRFYRRV